MLAIEDLGYQILKIIFFLSSMEGEHLERGCRVLSSVIDRRGTSYSIRIDIDGSE